MHRQISYLFVGLLAAGLLLAAPAVAGDEALQEKVRQLEERLDVLAAQQSTQLEQAIENYLDESSSWRAAQAGGTGGMTVTANLTGIFGASVDFDPHNSHILAGDVDVNFAFEVTEMLDLHVQMTANTADREKYDGGGARPVDRTFSALDDGIGVDGTTPTAPGSVRLYQAFFVHEVALGSTTLFWEAGAMDPRERFLQNAFADDENTQFVNNLFDDNPSFEWGTMNHQGLLGIPDQPAAVSAFPQLGSPTILGVHFWTSFGDNQQYTVNFGWFNTPGEFFNHGAAGVQFAWKGEVSGRAMNLRVALQYSTVVGRVDPDNSEDSNSALGVSWDWLATDNIGVFVRAAMNFSDVLFAQWDFALGAQFSNLIESRKDDVLGVAIGMIQVNDKVVDSVFGAGTTNRIEDTETTIEIYYRYTREDGKFQFTPYLQWIMDPGGGEQVWGDPKLDKLIIIGFRVHVPF